MAVAAVATYLLIVGFSASPSLGAHRRSGTDPAPVPDEFAADGFGR
jgi:hypothetical protein